MKVLFRWSVLRRHPQTVVHWLLTGFASVLVAGSLWAMLPRSRPQPRVPIPRTPISFSQILFRAQAVLSELPTEAQPYQRLLTLHHWHNQPGVADAELAECWCALAKWADRQTPGASAKWRVLHPAARLIDLRTCGIADGDEWDQRWRAYPYGLCYDTHAERNVRRWADTLRKLTQCQQPVLRADWLAVTVAADAAPNVWQRYHAPLNWADLAWELGWTEPRNFVPFLAELPELQPARNGTIARRRWAESPGQLSLFQRTAGTLGIGTPLRID